MPEYLECVRKGIPALFMHLLLFWDGFPLWRRRITGYGVVAITCGEFPHGMRGSRNSPGIAPHSNHADCENGECGCFVEIDYEGIVYVD